MERSARAEHQDPQFVNPRFFVKFQARPPNRSRFRWRSRSRSCATGRRSRYWGRTSRSQASVPSSNAHHSSCVRVLNNAAPDGQTGWLAGLREPYVARALALLHRDITRRWTVDDLGREVGLSRSALADRFLRLIGVPPMHYLANWRMQVATQKLRNTSASLAQIAETVGYDSEAAFSRAFKKAFGAAPATWRRSNS